MSLFKKVSLLFIAVSMLCGEEVFARYHFRHSDGELSRSAKRLQKARKEQRRADRNAEKKRQKRIREERRFNRKIDRHQNRRFDRRRSSSPVLPTPQDEWIVAHTNSGMTEITRIRYRNVLYRGKRLAAPVRLPQRPITVPTSLADLTLARLKEMAAKEPKLSPMVIKKNHRKRRFF